MGMKKTSFLSIYKWHLLEGEKERVMKRNESIYQISEIPDPYFPEYQIESGGDLTGTIKRI